MVALIDAPLHIFHLHMYALGERLRYKALMAAALDKIWDVLYRRMKNSDDGLIHMLRDCVSACFSPHGSEARVCQDEDEVLQQTIVAAVLFQAVAHWKSAHHERARAGLDGLQSEPFWALYHNIKDQNADLVGTISRHRNRVLEREIADLKADQEPVRRGDRRAKLAARKIMRKKAQQAANAQNALSSISATPSVPVANGLQATETADTHMTDEAQHRRNKKKKARRSKAQAAEAALAMNADVFSSIDKERAMADLAAHRGFSPIQMQSATALSYGEDEGFGGSVKNWDHDVKDVEMEMRDGMRRMHIGHSVRE